MKSRPKLKPVYERFSDKWVHEPNSGCWLWLGATTGNKYGAIKAGGKKIGAHVISWMLHNKQNVPQGMFVCHRCDTPLCVNPAHLFLSNHQGNVQDCVSKNRHAYGERNWFSKLNWDKVDFIHSSDLPSSSLAKSLGVSYKTVKRVRSGETWNYPRN